MPFSRFSRLYAAATAVALIALLAACGGKRTPALAGAAPGGAEESASDAATAPPPQTQAVDEGPDVRAIEGEGASGADIGGAGSTTGGQDGPLADVRFEYDSAELTDEARAILEKHALWLQSQRGVAVTIEGHCDERGTVEYNLALGEQRARAARDYLVSLGVDGARLRVVSYGKERLLDSGADEAAHARNRRAHFAVR